MKKNNTIKKIGIVGGGQLGRMLAFEAKRMGLYVVVTDPTPQSPAGQVADLQIVGGYKEEKVIKILSKISDVVTIDAEFVNDEVLQKLADKGQRIHPSPKTIKMIKDKYRQKKFLRKHKIPTAEFIEVRTDKDIVNASQKFGYPFLLKARTDAYDGKGNYLVNSERDIPKALEKLKDRSLYVEKYVHFKKELSVIVARSTKGEIKVYPVVETIHEDNICDLVIAPAQIPLRARKNAGLLARKTMKKLQGAGVFALEMFLEKNNSVLINEIAPRVHNSGHFTIEASYTSQFEQHIRAICGFPLGDTSMRVKFAVMKNILGTKSGDGEPKGIEKVLKIPNLTIHMYGKKEGRVGRKMGHITVTGNNLQEVLRKAQKGRRLLSI